MATHVNLDALIPRADFDTGTTERARGEKPDTISYTSLEPKNWFYRALRKPDFQRETSDWEPRKVADFIQSFLSGDLIPAIICWESPNSDIFVIDGCHRLSCLVAWINDDYGNGAVSKNFYDTMIPDEQRRIAQKTRLLIEKEIGTFDDHMLAGTSPEKVSSQIAEQARRLGPRSVKLQWIEGSSETAGKSFLKINQSAAPINPTEMRVLANRHRPLGIAARAIVRSGEGHKYWARFDLEKQGALERLAKQVHDLLFKPALPPGSITTTELPIGGPAYAAQSLPLILEFILYVNGTAIDVEDATGEVTLASLQRCKRLAEAINSNDPGSLGLHPLVYFYAQNGRHRIASFWAITLLIKELVERKQLLKFTRVRAKFEELLIEYDYLVQEVVRLRRGATAGVPLVKDFYVMCIDALDGGKGVEEAVKQVVADPKFARLSKLALERVEREVGTEFNKETRSEAFIRAPRVSIVKCPQCGGMMQGKAMTMDHIQRKQDGGSGDVTNAQPMHPYCNSAVKESHVAKERGG